MKERTAIKHLHKFTEKRKPFKHEKHNYFDEFGKTY